MGTLTVYIPALLAALSAIAAAWYARRSQSESNRSADWQAFVKAQAELLISPLRQELDEAKRDIAELKAELRERGSELRDAFGYIRVLLKVLAAKRIQAPPLPESIAERFDDGI